MGGYDPYSGSKGCAELVTSAYRSSFFLHSGDRQEEIVVASARAGNVIGGGDWAKDRLIPDILSSLALFNIVLISNTVMKNKNTEYYGCMATACIRSPVPSELTATSINEI